MQVQTKLANDIDAVGGPDAQYDKNAKKLLVHKNILAWILKECIDEYKELPLSEIENYIEGIPEIGNVAVHRDMPGANEIIGDNTEDVSTKEQTVYFDIRFRVVVPGKDEFIQIFINLEIQVDPQKGYPLEKRVIYYLSRMISAQYGPVFTHSQYGKIRKVYSIWIVPNPAKSRRNTIRKLSVKADDLLGRYGGKKEDYDLMTGIILSLSSDEDESDNKVLRLLDVLLSKSKVPLRKKEILEKDFNIPFTEELKSEVESMCNLSEEIKAEGRREYLVTAICKKLRKGKNADMIAEELEEELSNILEICKIAEKYAPEYKEEAIISDMKNL